MYLYISRDDKTGVLFLAQGQTRISGGAHIIIMCDERERGDGRVQGGGRG